MVARRGAAQNTDSLPHCISNDDNDSQNGTETYPVKEGDTIWAIIGEDYGDPTIWPMVPDTNDIAEPRRITQPTGDAKLVVNTYTPVPTSGSVLFKLYFDRELGDRVEKKTGEEDKSVGARLSTNITGIRPGRHLIKLVQTAGKVHRCYLGAFIAKPPESDTTEDN